MTKVYISSTFSDLKEYRMGVSHALDRMGHVVIAMEKYVASPRRPLEDCLRDVADCELYIGIFAWRYGFIPTTADPEQPEAGNLAQKSITELEYLHAGKLGKDRLIFLLDEGASWPKKLIEGGAGGEHIETFRKRLGDDHVVDFFNDLGELTTKVSTAVAVWARREAAAPPEGAPKEEEEPAVPEVNVARLPVTGSQLFGREAELKALDEAWEDGETHVFSFIAWGGVGKSALVNKWLNNLARDDYRGAEKVYAWSFYRQGTSEQGVSADQFIDAALRWFGDPDPTAGTPWDKGERLARLVRRQRTLLLLDGLEPLQFSPGRGHKEGALKEHSMQALLRELAAHNPGLCIITSRLAVADLADSEGNTARRINLEHLSPQAGAAVLRGQGVKGEHAELERASTEFGGHALALTLLGSYLVNVHDGDIARRDRVDILREDEEQGGHARRVMASYEKWFGEGPELSVLRILGLFDRPADGPSITTLRAAPAIPGLTDHLQPLTEEDWRRTLGRIRAAKLIADRDPDHLDTVDAHPLVREYFKQQLKRTNPEAWRDGNSRLYEHLRDTTIDFPNTIEEMTPLYAAVAHGCAVDRHEEALNEIYWKRMSREGEFFNTKKLGAFSADLAVLTGFFNPPWYQPIQTLPDDSKGYILAVAGYTLRAVGRLVEAIQLTKASMEAAIEQGDMQNAARAASTLSEINLAMGAIPQALSHAQQGFEMAKTSGNPLEMIGTGATVASVLHKMGNLSEAESLFAEVELLQNNTLRPKLPMYSLQGFDYCDLLLDQGNYQEVLSRSLQTLEFSKEHLGLLSIAFNHLSIGRAYLLKALREATGEFSQAESHINHSIEDLRRSEVLDFLPRGLLARSELNRAKNAYGQARINLDEAMSIAKRGGMELHQADCHLEYARLYLAEGKKEKAREHLATAKEMIERMGYHLRDGEVEEIGRELEGG